MHFEEFAYGKSVFHRLDPRTRFIVYIPLVVVVAAFESINLSMAALLLSAIMLFGAGLPVRAVVNRLLVINFFVLCLWLTIPFSIEGKELFSLGLITCSREGVLYALLISIKANSIYIFTMLILGTSEIFPLVYALNDLRFPKKIVYMFFFTYRYISVLHDEYDKIVAALKVRGFVPETNVHTLKTYSYVMGMLLIKSYDRSIRVYQALKLRGFNDEFPLMHEYKFRSRDYSFIVIFTIIIIGFIIWK